MEKTRFPTFIVHVSRAEKIESTTFPLMSDELNYSDSFLLLMYWSQGFVMNF